MTYEIIPQFGVVLALVGIIVILGRKIPEVRELKIDAISVPKRNRKRFLAVLKGSLPRLGYFILSAFKGSGRMIVQLFVLSGRGFKILGSRMRNFLEKRKKNREVRQQKEEVQEKTILRESNSLRIMPGLKERKPFSSQKLKIKEVRIEAHSAPLEREELNIEQLLTDAENAVRLKHFQAAEKLCFSIIRKNPKNAQVYKILGNLYFAEGNFRDAEASFRAALKRGADSTDLYRKLGLAYTEEGRTKEAEKIYRRAIKNNRTKEYFYLELGKIYRNQNNVDKALRIYEELARAYPGNYKYLELLEKQRKMRK